jgi:hypothetical protein
MEAFTIGNLIRMTKEQLNVLKRLGKIKTANTELPPFTAGFGWLLLSATKKTYWPLHPIVNILNHILKKIVNT